VNIFPVSRQPVGRQTPLQPISARLLNRVAVASEDASVSTGLASGLAITHTSGAVAIRALARQNPIGKVTTYVSARSSGTTYTTDGRVTLMSDDPAAGQLVEVATDIPVCNFKKIGFIVGAYVDLSYRYGRLFVDGPSDCSDVG